MFQYSVRYQKIIFQFYRHDTCVSKENEKYGKYSKIPFDIKEEHLSIYPSEKYIRRIWSQPDLP